MATLNEFMSCSQCKHWRESMTVEDHFYGTVTIRSYCTRRMAKVKAEKAKDCRLYLSR